MSRKMLAREVAEHLRISVESVYDAVRSGVIPAQRLRPGGKLLFDLDAVEAALVRSGGQVGTAQAAGAETAEAGTATC
jgi:excisionase family DNA binding protein